MDVFSSLVHLFNIYAYPYGSSSALMLFVWQQEGQMACRNWVMRCWRANVCIWSSWCHCHSIISCALKIQNGLPLWCRLTQVVLEKKCR